MDPMKVVIKVLEDGGDTKDIYLSGSSLFARTIEKHLKHLNPHEPKTYSGEDLLREIKKAGVSAYAEIKQQQGKENAMKETGTANVEVKATGSEEFIYTNANYRIVSVY